MNTCVQKKVSIITSTSKVRSQYLLYSSCYSEPVISDITLKESIPFVRELANNVILDVPYFMSGHRESMIKSVRHTGLHCVFKIPLTSVAQVCEEAYVQLAHWAFDRMLRSLSGTMFIASGVSATPASTSADASYVSSTPARPDPYRLVRSTSSHTRWAARLSRTSYRINQHT